MTIKTAAKFQISVESPIWELAQKVTPCLWTRSHDMMFIDSEWVLEDPNDDKDYQRLVEALDQESAMAGWRNCDILYIWPS